MCRQVSDFFLRLKSKTSVCRAACFSGINRSSLTFLPERRWTCILELSRLRLQLWFLTAAADGVFFCQRQIYLKKSCQDERWVQRHCELYREEVFSEQEKTFTHHRLFLSLRWLQPQSVKGHQQRTVYGARMFWLGGRLPIGGRAAHRAPQPGRPEHAQWSRHGAAGPICGGYVPQRQTLNMKSVTGSTHMELQCIECTNLNMHANDLYMATVHASTATKIHSMWKTRTCARSCTNTFKGGDSWTNTVYTCFMQSYSDTRTSSCFSDFIILFSVSRCSLKSASAPRTDTWGDPARSRSPPAHSLPEAMATSSPWLHTIATPSPCWGAAEMPKHDLLFSSKWGNVTDHSWSSQTCRRWNIWQVERDAAAASGSWTVVVEMKSFCFKCISLHMLSDYFWDVCHRSIRI